MNERINKIKGLVADFFYKTGLPNLEVSVIEVETDGSLNISLLTQDASMYIGERGKNIGVFETILRLGIKKQLGEVPMFHLDINSYRALREGALKELAKKAAHRARIYKKPVALEAMPAYDRKVIHSELATHPDIKTESIGEGEKRRVVVNPIN